MHEHPFLHSDDNEDADDDNHTREEDKKPLWLTESFIEAKRFSAEVSRRHPQS